MPAYDEYPQGHLLGSATGGGSVTPSDSTELTYTTRGLYVGVAGNVAVVMADGTSVTLTGLAAGVVHPLRVKQVRSTGTTATGIVGFW